MKTEASNRADTKGHFLIRAKNVKVHYSIARGLAGSGKKRLRAVDGVDLKISRKEILGLVGESGCGKSTLGRCMAALERPTSGTVLFEEDDLFRMPRAKYRLVRPRIQMVFQDPRGSLDPRMTIEASLTEPLRVAGKLSGKSARTEGRTRARELLDSVGLDPAYAGRFPHELSGGELQRVALARATALGPAFLVADEPVSALDPSVRAQVIDLLLSMGERLGLSLLLIIHDLPLAARICNTVAVMYLGKIMEIAPSSSLADGACHPYTRALIASSRSYRDGIERIKGEPESPIDIPSGCRFRRRCPEAVQICREAEPALEKKKKKNEHRAACHLVE